MFRLLLEAKSRNRNFAPGLKIISIRHIWILDGVLGGRNQRKTVLKPVLDLVRGWVR